MKKLKFIKFLYKKIIGALVISAAICGLIFPFYRVIVENMRYTMAYDIIDATHISLMKSYIAFGMNEAVVKRALTMNADKDPSMDIAMAIVDKDNNMELIATSERATTLIVRGEEPRMFICATDELMAVRERNSILGEWIVMEEIYADGDYFYPGIVKIIDYDKYLMGTYTEADVLESYDFTPENAEEYEHIEGAVSLSFDFGTEPESRAMKFLDQHYLKGNMDYEDDEMFFDQWNFSIGDKNYKLYIVCGFDFVIYAKSTIIVVITGIFLISLIAAFVWAYVQYKKYCNQYEIDEFRRNMTSALAHDLKTPLTAVMGYAENLRDNIHTEKREHYADSVIENVRYMNGIITNTLELARIEGQEGVKPEEVDMLALAKGLLSKYRANADDRGISIVLEGKCRIKADSRLISRAVENLIANAVKYASDGGEIKITADQKSFAVENTCDSSLNGGTDDFCKPFFKADSSRSDRSGEGLGLAAVKNIAAMHRFKFKADAHDGRFISQIIFK